MKVPIRYKSSDRYNAGVDVVYDDESKLQYAPFIYATTQSGDNGGAGEDEEGEDVMVVNIIWDSELSNNKLDKNWSEIKTEPAAGKLVMLKEVPNADAFRMCYLAELYTEKTLGVSGMTYNIIVLSVDNNHSPVAVKYTSDSETGTMVQVVGD